MIIIDTHVSDIEEAFKSFSNRDDIGIILISQYVSNKDDIGIILISQNMNKRNNYRIVSLLDK